MLDYLFVYGTLRAAHDGSVHAFLRRRTVYIAQATLPGRLFQLKGYPGAVIMPIGNRQLIYGEVYRLLRPVQTLQRLDDYEECSDRFPKPHEYRRRTEIVTLANGKRLHAWMYMYLGPTRRLRPIASGNYAAFLAHSHCSV